MEYYLTMKKNGVLIHTATWVSLENSMLNEKKKTDAKGNILCNSICMKYPE